MSRERVQLIHWNAEEAKERAQRLAAAGYEVDHELSGGSAFVREMGQTKLYVDGVAFGPTLTSGLNTPNGWFMVGGNPGNAVEAFDGQLDEIRLSRFTGPFDPSMLLREPILIPEPATLAILALGVAPLLRRRRRSP